MKPDVHVFPSVREMACRLAQELEKMAKERTIAVALSGGDTPKPFLAFLAQEYARKIDWPNIHFYWADERCVPASHPESNYGMAKERLFDRIPIPVCNIHRIVGENDPVTEAARYSEEIKSNLERLEGIPRFDLILLGIGTDGHTASIFPDQMHLLHSEQECEVALHPRSGQKRITLTGRVIDHASRIVFLATGEAKSYAIEKVLSEKPEALAFPAFHIRPVHGVLEWFLDAQAAKGVSS